MEKKIVKNVGLWEKGKNSLMSLNMRWNKRLLTLWTLTALEKSLFCVEKFEDFLVETLSTLLLNFYYFISCDSTTKTGATRSAFNNAIMQSCVFYLLLIFLHSLRMKCVAI